MWEPGKQVYGPLQGQGVKICRALHLRMGATQHWVRDCAILQKIGLEQ
jgi:hypothetical protein